MSLTTPVRSLAPQTDAGAADMQPLLVRNPLTGEELYRIRELTEAESAKLFAEARQEFARLRLSSLTERLAELGKIRDFILRERDNLVDQVMLETGKCRTDALVSEVMGVLDYLDWLIAQAPKILADQKVSTPMTLMGKKSRIFHEALGVVLIIAPWNYPFHIAMTAIAAALAAGNAVVFKGSEVTPLRGLLEQVLAASPLLHSAVKIGYGGGQTAQRFIAQRPAKIFFTGSARTGRRILAQAAPLLIPVELELGGKDAAIVFSDVDITRTVAGVLWGAVTNAGQSCTSVERLFVQAPIYDEFVARLRQAAQGLVINAGDAGDADVGSLSVGFQMQTVERHIQSARVQGANVLCGGEPLYTDSLFYPPTLLEDVGLDQPAWTEETFGPTLVIRRFEEEAEVIEAVNADDFGLSASVWSANLKRAERVARALEVGAVSINNVMLTEGNPALPFGGTKASGFGRVKGAEGLLGMTRSKAVIIDKQSAKIEANWYPYTRQKYHLFDRFIRALFGRGWRRWLELVRVGLQLETEAQKGRHSDSH